jgi:formylmethanofuran dehydrogenase subunit A
MKQDELPGGRYKIPDLRWVVRDGERVLQALFMNQKTGRLYWVDVPVEDETKEPLT